MIRGRTSRALLFVLSLSALAARCGGSSPIPEPTPPPPPPPPPPPATLTMTCPAGQSGLSLQNQPVTISWSAPTTAGGTASVQTACTPASGSTFSSGVTAVTCTATDAASQRATCTFNVTITRPPQITVTRFLAYGDSITWGKDRPAVPLPAFSELPPVTSYPSVLGTLLVSRYPDQAITIVNEGWPGEMVDTGKSRLPGVLAATSPQVLLLLHGANDLNTTAVNSGTTVSIANGLRELVRTAKARVPGIRVMLVLFPPQFHPTAAERGSDGKDNGEGADFVPMLNERIASVAQSEGATLVDLYTPLAANIKLNIGNDGLHPTVQGFARMAETFNQAIQRAFETKAVGSLPDRW